MDNLDKAIKILKEYKTEDAETKRQIKKAIGIIYEGLEFEQSYKEYMTSENVNLQLNNPSKLNNKYVEDWRLEAAKEIPF